MHAPRAPACHVVARRLSGRCAACRSLPRGRTAMAAVGADRAPRSPACSEACIASPCAAASWRRWPAGARRTRRCSRHRDAASWRHAAVQPGPRHHLQPARGARRRSGRHRAGRRGWLPLVSATLYVVANLFLLLLAVTIAFRSRSPAPGCSARAIGALRAAHAGGAAAGHARRAAGALRDRDALGAHTLRARLRRDCRWRCSPAAPAGRAGDARVRRGNAAQSARRRLVLLGRLRRWLDRRAVRYAAALLLAAFALAGLCRALFGPMAQGHGAFCIVP